MLILVIGLCLLWIALAIVGILVKAVAWLVFVAGALFVATVIAGAVHATKRG